MPVLNFNQLEPSGSKYLRTKSLFEYFKTQKRFFLPKSHRHVFSNTSEWIMTSLATILCLTILETIFYSSFTGHFVLQIVHKKDSHFSHIIFVVKKFVSTNFKNSYSPMYMPIFSFVQLSVVYIFLLLQITLLKKLQQRCPAVHST